MACIYLIVGMHKADRLDGAHLVQPIMPGPDQQVRARHTQHPDISLVHDAAEVLSLDEQARVPFGHFRDVLLTKDFTSLEPKVLEYKLYAPGIGPVLVVGVSGGSDREELLSFDLPST